MSELTLMLMRLALLIGLWLFVFSVVGVLKGDLYGTAIRPRPARRAAKAGTAAKAATGEAGHTHGAPASAAAPSVGSAAHAAGRAAGAAQEPSRLVVTDGPLAGTSLPLRRSGTLIGRAAECSLVLDDDYSSGRHARISHDGQTWVVEDLGSTNGTFLGATKITEPRPVAVGSVIKVGRTTVELQR